MTHRFAPWTRMSAFAALMLLAGCGNSQASIAALDNQLLADADPALTSALEDQILVDPALVQQAHPLAVRPPETPVQAQYPADPLPEGPVRLAAADMAPTPVRRAALTSDGGAPVPGMPPARRAPEITGACGAALEFGREWADRLPAEFPAYPGGRVTEAAGSNAGDCRVRVVTFRTADAFGRVLDFYRGIAQRAGFSAEHQLRGQDHLLGGVNERTDSAFVVIVTPADEGSEVALIVNKGR